MEADLLRFYGVDYRDRWRKSGDLTLRRLHVLITNLPPESACVRLELDGPWWSLEAHLLDDLRMVTEQLAHVMSGSKRKPKVKVHPLREKQARSAKKHDADFARKVAAFKQRRRLRQLAIERGEIRDPEPREEVT